MKSLKWYERPFRLHLMMQWHSAWRGFSEKLHAELNAWGVRKTENDTTSCPTMSDHAQTQPEVALAGSGLTHTQRKVLHTCDHRWRGEAQCEVLLRLRACDSAHALALFGHKSEVKHTRWVMYKCEMKKCGALQQHCYYFSILHFILRIS